MYGVLYVCMCGRVRFPKFFISPFSFLTLLLRSLICYMSRNRNNYVAYSAHSSLKRSVKEEGGKKKLIMSSHTLYVLKKFYKLKAREKVSF